MGGVGMLEGRIHFEAAYVGVDPSEDSQARYGRRRTLQWATRLLTYTRARAGRWLRVPVQRRLVNDGCTMSCLGLRSRAFQTLHSVYGNAKHEPKPLRFYSLVLNIECSMKL